jgi:hypothetical protein
MHATLFAVSALAAFTSTVAAAPKVIITEIMYNPSSNEKKGETEWVEIANVGDTAIDIKNWRLADDTEKRAKKWGTFNCALGPGEVAVLINADAVTEEQFRAAWDPASESGDAAAIAYQVIPVNWGALRNKPGDDNHGLQLLNENESVICTVNYRDGDDWPNCSKPDGASIWLADINAVNFSDGKLWKRSEPGNDGARLSTKTDIFDKQDAGSPGSITKPSAPVEAATQPAAEPAKKPDAATTEY